MSDGHESVPPVCRSSKFRATVAGGVREPKRAVGHEKRSRAPRNPTPATASRLRTAIDPARRDRRVGIATLIEDNAINQEIAKELLEQEGAVVSLADHGGQALEILERDGVDAFDVALVDLQMPEMDGYEATRRIRALPGGDRLSLIAMTAHTAGREPSWLAAAAAAVQELDYERALAELAPRPDAAR